MNPLEAILAPAVAVINRQIRLVTPARELCAELEGSVIALRVSNTALATYFKVGGETIRLTSDFDEEPDATISGSLVSLATLARNESAIRSGAVELRGDAEVAQSFHQLLRLARPDLEEELARVAGDAPAHAIGEVARRVGAWGRDAGRTMQQNITEYLQEESRSLPSRNEIDAFQRDIERLRDGAARLDARIRLLESQTDTE